MGRWGYRVQLFTAVKISYDVWPSFTSAVPLYIFVLFKTNRTSVWKQGVVWDGRCLSEEPGSAGAECSTCIRPLNYSALWIIESRRSFLGPCLGAPASQLYPPFETSEAGGKSGKNNSDSLSLRDKITALLAQQWMLQNPTFGKDSVHCSVVLPPEDIIGHSCLTHGVCGGPQSRLTAVRFWFSSSSGLLPWRLGFCPSLRGLSGHSKLSDWCMRPWMKWWPPWPAASHLVVIIFSGTCVEQAEMETLLLSSSSMTSLVLFFCRSYLILMKIREADQDINIWKS